MTTKKAEKPMTNEKTSKRVAAIAGKVLASLSHIQDDSPTKCRSCGCAIHIACRALGITVADLKALAASTLTQASDKPKVKK